METAERATGSNMWALGKVNTFILRYRGNWYFYDNTIFKTLPACSCDYLQHLEVFPITVHTKIAS